MESPEDRHCAPVELGSFVSNGRPIADSHNEKMLPRSYSEASWQQWVCITFDTVWCITTTSTRGAIAIVSRAPVECVAGPSAPRRSLGLILLIGPALRLPPAARDVGHVARD
jgi:hypothetical protein